MTKFYALVSFVISAALLGGFFATAEDSPQNANKFVFETEELPSDFPMPIVTIDDGSSPGYFFTGMIALGGSDPVYGNYMMILDREGIPVAYKNIGFGNARRALNFMQMENGELVHVELSAPLGAAYVDESAEPDIVSIDSLVNNNPRKITAYLRKLPNGHYLLLQFELWPADLSLVFPEGEPNGTVRASAIREYDKDKNLVFQWLSQDRVDVKDTYLDPSMALLPYIHTNNVIVDRDGNLLLSNRHMSNVFKVSRRTGEILWTLGGKKNEFDFIGEHEENAPNYFSFQHDIRRLPNGNISIFDNGTQHEPPYSRGVEYVIDEENKTVEMVWEYVHELGMHSIAHGSCQRQPNGNVVLGWGQTVQENMPAITELDPENNVVFELYYPTDFLSMRAVKFPYKTDVPQAKIKKEVNKNNTYDFSDAEEEVCLEVTITELEETLYAFLDARKFGFSPINAEFDEDIPPFTIAPVRVEISKSGIDAVEADMRFDADCLGITYEPEKYYVYYRPTPGEGVFKQLITIYDPVDNVYMVSGVPVGEFCFAISEPIFAPGEPLLTAPADGAKPDKNKPVQLTWSPRGYFTESHLQVSEDETFDNLIVDEFMTGAVDYTLTDIAEYSKLYWRVACSIGGNSGEFSEPFEFEPGDPFIEQVSPIGGEVWEKDPTRNVIRWKTNTSDIVKIELLKSGELHTEITASINCPTGAFGWKIPADVPDGDDYAIRVTSLSNPELVAESPEPFEIVAASAVNEIAKVNKIDVQVYPNPASENVTFEFHVPDYGDATIEVFDQFGGSLGVIYRENLAPGTYRTFGGEFQTAGIYFVQISQNGVLGSARFVVVK